MDVPTSSSADTSKAIHRFRDQKGDDYVTLTEKVDLTEKQYEVLNIVCTTYGKSLSEYMQEAIVEAMKSDIEEGNFCDALLDKLDGDDQKVDKRMSSNSPAFIEDDINQLQF